MNQRLSVIFAAAAVAATAAPAFAQQVAVSGVVYAQYSYSTARDTLAADSTVGHVNAFDVTRAYVNVLGRFGGGIATRVTGDVYNNGGSRAFRLKYAYVGWTPEGSALTWKFGQTQTPWLDWEEMLWDYRMQGGMAMDRNGYLSASDFGAAVEGNINHEALDFVAGVYNGQNYNGTRSDQGKDVMARASLRLAGSDDGSRVGGLRLTGYAQYGRPLSGGQRERFIGMLSYRTSIVTLAGELAATTDSTTGGNTTVGGGSVNAKPQDKGSVLSVFGVFHPPATKIGVIARVDMADPNTSASGDKQTRVIAGASYQLTPNVRLLGDIDAVSYESGFTPTTTNYAAYVQRSTANFHVQFTF